MKKWLVAILIFLSGCASVYYFGEQEIKMVERNDMHFVNITLNGKKTKLLVDTGASKSLLDISQAEDFDFSYLLLSKNQYIGIGGVQDIFVVYDYKVLETWITFLGADMSEVREYFRKDGIDIVGILGSDFLEDSRAKIDFKTNIIYYNRD